MIMMSSDTTHTTQISPRTLNGPPNEPTERELHGKLEHTESRRELAAALCRVLLARQDLHSNRPRYRELERAIAQLVRANMEHVRALAELGDYLVDGTVHHRR